MREALKAAGICLRYQSCAQRRARAEGKRLTGFMLINDDAEDKGHLLDEVPEPELAPLPDPDVFSGEQWRQASELLELDEVPRRLSGLLADARVLDPDLPLLVALRVLHALAPEIGVAVRQGDDAVLLAVDDGAVLHDPQFGASDLLVGVARLDADGTAVAEMLSGEEVA